MEETVVFVEFKEDAEYLTSRLLLDWSGQPPRIIALDDDAVFHLRNHNIFFTHVEEFLTPAEEGKLCSATWLRLEELTSYVDDYLIGKSGVLTPGAPYLTAQMEVLKVTFDAVVMRVAILRSIFQQCKPARIAFARNDLVLPRHHRYFYDESFSLYSVLLQTKGTELAGYPLKMESWNSRYRLGTSPRGHVSSAAMTARKFRDVLFALLQPRLRRPSSLSASAPKQICVVGGAEASLRHVVTDLQQQGCAIAPWRPQTLLAPAPCGSRGRRLWRILRNGCRYIHLTSRLKALFKQLDKDPGYQKLLSWDGIDLRPLLTGIVRIAATKVAAHQEIILSEASRLAEHADILLSSYYSTHQRPCAFAARRRGGVQVVSVQHGAMGHDAGGKGWEMEKNPLRPSNKIYYLIDMADVDVKLLWGEGEASEMAQWRFHTAHPRLAVYGAPHLRTIRGVRRPPAAGSRRILYVSNAVGNNVYPLMNFRGLGYRIRQYAIMETLASHAANHEIIYKAYPYWNRNEVFDLILHKYPHKKLTYASSREKLTDLFHQVDCTIFDFATTGFFEACLTGLPVFLYNSVYAFSPELQEMLIKRVYYSEDLESFHQMFDRYQSHPEQFPARQDDSFVRAFVDTEKISNVFDLLMETR